jgi:copper chaperone
MSTIHLEVQGMRCGGCVKSVTAALNQLPGVNNVSVDLPAGHVTVNGDLTQGGDPLVLALTAAGYPAKLVAAAQSETTTTTVPSAKKSGGCCG